MTPRSRTNDQQGTFLADQPAGASAKDGPRHSQKAPKVNVSHRSFCLKEECDSPATDYADGRKTDFGCARLLARKRRGEQSSDTQRREQESRVSYIQLALSGVFLHRGERSPRFLRASSTPVSQSSGETEAVSRADSVTCHPSSARTWCSATRAYRRRAADEEVRRAREHV